MLDDAVQASTSFSAGLRHFEPDATIEARPAPHPNDIDWHSQGRGWPGYKHAYSILWRRHVFEGGGVIYGSRIMALILHCSWGTEHKRTSRLEDMGLLEIVRGSSVAGGAEEDVASEYRLAGTGCQVEQQSELEGVYKQYTRLEGSLEKNNECLDLLLDLATPPDQDRWRQERYGPVGWLMAADPLGDEPFTVKQMADRLGVSGKAVRTALAKMSSDDLVCQEPGARYRLDVPVELPTDLSDRFLGELAGDAPALRRFLARTTTADTSITDRQQKDLVQRLMRRRAEPLYAGLVMLVKHPGKRMDGSALLPAWTRDYCLTRRGWELRVPTVVDDWGMPWKQGRILLEDTFTHRPRTDADAVQPLLTDRPTVEGEMEQAVAIAEVSDLSVWQHQMQRRAPSLNPHWVPGQLSQPGQGADL